MPSRSASPSQRAGLRRRSSRCRRRETCPMPRCPGSESFRAAPAPGGIATSTSTDKTRCGAPPSTLPWAPRVPRGTSLNQFSRRRALARQCRVRSCLVKSHYVRAIAWRRHSRPGQGGACCPWKYVLFACGDITRVCLVVVVMVDSSSPEALSAQRSSLSSSTRHVWSRGREGRSVPSRSGRPAAPGRRAVCAPGLPSILIHLRRLSRSLVRSL